MELGQAALQRALYIAKSIPALKCIAPAAGRALYINELGACIHAAAGRLNDGPGILLGADSPPVISLASFLSILKNFLLSLHMMVLGPFYHV